MRKLMIINFFFVMTAFNLVALEECIVNGGCTGENYNNGHIQVADPMSGTVKFSRDWPTGSNLLSASTAYFFNPNDNSYKIIFGGTYEFTINSLTIKGFGDTITVKHTMPATQYADFPSFVSYAKSFINSDVPQVPSMITTVALVEKQENIFTILIGDQNGFTTEYDLSGKKIRVLEKQQKNDRGGVNAFMMFENEGKFYLASGGNNGQIFIRDFVSGKVLKEFNAPKAVSSLVAYKQDQNMYLIAGMSGYTMSNNPIGGIIGWNLNTGDQEYSIDYNSSGSSGIEPGQWGFVSGLALVDEMLITIATDAMVKVWNPKTGEFIKELNNGLRPTESWVTNIVPYKKGETTYIAVGNLSGRIDIWDLGETAIVSTVQMPAPGPEGASVFCRNISLIENSAHEIYLSATGDAGASVTWSLDNFEQISAIPPSDNTLMFRSVTNLPKINAQYGIVSNSSSYNTGNDIPLFSAQVNQSL